MDKTQGVNPADQPGQCIPRQPIPLGTSLAPTVGSFNHCDSQANTPGALKRATLEVKMVHLPIIADDRVNLLTKMKI